MTQLQIQLERLRRARAIVRNIEDSIAAISDIEDRLEDTLAEVGERVGRPIFKPLRLTSRVEAIIAPVKTKTLFTRVVAPILRSLGRLLISGSGTFTIEELENAQITVFYTPERGYIAGMEFQPLRGTFYKTITRAERLDLEKVIPDTALIARLFTANEDPDHF